MQGPAHGSGQCQAQTQVGHERAESSSEGKDLGVLVNEKPSRT